LTRLTILPPTDLPPTGQTQQASLRRLDWRFLLPRNGKFRHLRLFGGPPGLAELMVAANLAEHVTCGGTDDADLPVCDPDGVDAVVLLNDGRASLKQAVAGLQPGGVLYQEIARRSLASLWLTPDVICRRLERAGLIPTGLYCAAPNFEDCRRYIPLDVPNAVRWYLSSLFVAGTPIHQLIGTLLGLVVGSRSDRLGWFAPCLSVTAVAGGGEKVAGNAEPSILSRPEIRRRLPNAGLRPLLLTSRQDDASRLVMLPFAPSHPNRAAAAEKPFAQEVALPQAVIKIATHPTFNQATELEQVVLQTVRAALDPQMRRSIPEALGSFHYDGLAVSVEGVAPGHSVWVSSGGWGTPSSAKIADLTMGVRWLTEFHTQMEVMRLPWDQQAITAWVEAPLAAYARGQRTTESERRLFDIMQAHAQSLVGETLPLAWQHHDFAPWNLYRAGEQFTVIDWEFNRGWDETRAGPGLCDLLYFVTHWYIIAHHLFTEAAELQALHTLFLCPAHKTDTICAVRSAVADYMAAHEIDRRFLPLLLVYTWVERVAYGRARARMLNTRASGKFVGYIQTLADHAGQLFSAAHLDALLG